MTSQWKLLTAATLAAVLVFSAGFVTSQLLPDASVSNATLGLAPVTTAAGATNTGEQLLGVILAGSLDSSGDPRVTTLSQVESSARVFTDRPDRQEKAVSATEVVETFWQNEQDPPNVTISGILPDGTLFTSIVEFASPTWLDETTLSFLTEDLEGDALDPVPANARDVSVTIDAAYDTCAVGVNQYLNLPEGNYVNVSMYFTAAPLVGTDPEGKPFALTFSVPNYDLGYGEAPDASQYQPTAGTDTVGYLATEGSAFEGCAGTVTWDVYCTSSAGFTDPVGQVIVEFANPMSGTYSATVTATDAVDLAGQQMSDPSGAQFGLAQAAFVDSRAYGCEWDYIGLPEAYLLSL